MEYSKTIFKSVLEQSNFKFKKKYGQNFITDYNIIKKIVEKSAIEKDSLVIEIGPGIGSLTYLLATVAKSVLCYEIDNEVKDVLKNNLKDYNNVSVIFQDFLQSNVKEDISKYQYEKLYVISNLPYYITTPIINKIIEDNIDVDKMVFMVQKEVGDRFKAQPNTKDYNSLSVYLNYYYEVRKLMDVSRNVFIPVPNVDSIVVEFKKREEKFELINKELFFKLVRDSFKQKRKTIKNNLGNYNLEVINKVLHKNGYNLSVRAEQLPIKVFVDISNALNNEQK